jgi:hypothetical protein
MDQCGDPLRVFGIGKAFEQAVSGAKDRKCHFGPVNERSETFVVPFARFAEEHGVNAAAGTQRFFDKSDALDSHESVFRRQPAAQSHTKLLQPAIVAARKWRGLASGARASSGFSRRCHYRGG